jgi:hypothetical protein
LIRFITRWALRLDLWLQERLGRPYRAILSIGLIIEIVRRLVELPEHLRRTESLVGAALIVVMNLALLVNQLGEMSHRVTARSAADGALPPRGRIRRRGGRPQDPPPA